MRTESGLYYGAVPSVLDVILSRHFEHLPQFCSALVLSIDSSRAALDIALMLSRFGAEARIEAATAVLTPTQLQQAASRGAFAPSFTEVWLLSHDRPSQEVPLQKRMGSDMESVCQGIHEVESLMNQIGCVLAMADGFDLGYATWDTAFANFVDSTFRRQDGTSGTTRESR